MTSREFAKGLEDNLYDGESIDDLVAMIDIFTIQRGIRHKTEPKTGDYLFSATILCVILTPCKPPEYRSSAQLMRQAFHGIHLNKEKQEFYAKAITPKALDLATVGQLAQIDFIELFNIELSGFGYME
jgi:hypothetical protein